MKFTATHPETGQTLTVEGDSVPTEAEWDQIFSATGGGQKPGFLDRVLPDKLNAALKWPEKKSREGLTTIAQAIPEQPIKSQSAALNYIGGIPRVAADTMAEAAPGFVSRGAMLTAGAMRVLNAVRPLASIARQGVFRQGEELSGIAPKTEGALNAAYKDPSLILSKGKGAAGKFYEAAKDEAEAARDTFRATRVSAKGKTVTMEKFKDILSGKYKPDQILDIANDFVAGGGQLDPTEALKVRKAIDVLLKSKSSVPDELYKMRNFYDGIAKGSAEIGTGDLLYQRGRNAEALRNIFPQNKYGGASAFKLALMAATQKLGGKAATLLFSPAAYGAGATALGLGARAATPFIENPSLAVSMQQLQQAIQRRKRNAK